MIQNFNIFNQPEIPSVSLCNPDTSILYSIEKIIYETEISLKYNSISTFTFKIPMSFDNGITTIDSYPLFQSKRLLFIDNIGYFLITKTTEEINGNIPVLGIESQSIESELLNKRLSGFTVNSCTLESLLNTLITNYIPNWDFTRNAEGNKISIPSELRSVVRTFDVQDTNIYSFLINDIQKAYGCIIIFNRLDRTFYVTSSNVENLHNTNILLSYDNLVLSSEFTQYSDEIATALYCYGGGGLDISNVNPLGNNLIYDFSNYNYDGTTWMSDTLRNSLNSWINDVKLEEELANDTYLTSVKNTGTTNLYYLCSLLSPYSLAINNRQSEVTRIENLLQSVVGSDDSSKKIRSYYSSNIKFLKTSNSSTKPTVTIPDEYWGVSINIPSEYQLDLNNLYKWDEYKSINSITNLDEYKNILSNISTYNTYVYHNKSKYSSKILLMSESYSRIAAYNTTLATRKDQCSTEETIMNSLIGENKTSNNNKIKDHKTNLSFLTYGLYTDIIPSTVSEKYKLHSNDNQLDEADLDSSEFFVVGGIDSINKLIETENVFIENLLRILSRINLYLKLYTNIGTGNYNELSPLIIENSFQNQYIIIDDTMYKDEIISNSSFLLSQSKEILKKVSQPRYEFSIELSNFINLTEYKDTFTKELELGNTVNVMIRDALIVPILLEIKFSLDKPEGLTLTFSNRLRLNNGKFQYADVFGKFFDINADVSFKNTEWSNWSEHKGDVTTFINSALDTSKNQIISSTDEEVKIGDYGLKVKKKLTDTNNSYSNEEMWLTNNQIVFTDDAWQTSKTALGKVNFDISTETYEYGIVGDAIVGNLIAGNELLISSGNADKYFEVSKDNVIFNNITLKMIDVAGITNKYLSIDVDNGIKIGTTGGTEESTEFKINADGSVYVKDFSVGTKLGMWAITPQGNTPSGGLEYIPAGTKTLQSFIYATPVGTDKTILKLANGFFTMTSDGAMVFGKSTGALTIDKVGNVTMPEANANSDLTFATLTGGTIKAKFKCGGTDGVTGEFKTANTPIKIVSVTNGIITSVVLAS